MTDKRHPDEERQALAAEHALGLLSGEDERRARELAAADSAFAREVARWRGRMAPLAEEIEAAAPPASVWDGIERETAGRAPANDNDLPGRTE